MEPRAARPRATASRPGTTIATGSVYRVSEGDTLSAIAARVRDRKVSLWTLAAAIQAANPDAFIRNDANLIKLGSEILIPDTTTAGTPATGPSLAPASTPAVAPAQAAMTPPAPVARAVNTDVVATPAAAAEPVLPAEAIQAAERLPAPIQSLQVETPAVATAPAPVAQRPVTPKPVAAPTDESLAAAADEPNPVVAAGAGILFGLCISALLWFRGRLPSRKRKTAKLAGDGDSPALTEAAAVATAVEPLVTRKTEPGFTVSYSPEFDDSLAAEFTDEPKPAAALQPAATSPVKAPQSAAPPATDEITSELEGLFDGTDTTIQKRLEAEKTVAALAVRGSDRDEFDPTDLEAGNTVDFLVGELNEDSNTSVVAPTVDQPRPDMSSTSDSGTVDIHALAAAATKDEQQAQTLLEALTLLERDYEEELTASQILDPSMVRKFVANDFDPTQVSEAQPRKKAR